MLEKMNLPSPDNVMKSYPFQLSGGMRQRVGIAMYMIFLRDVKEEFFQHLIHNPSGFFQAHPCVQMFSQIHVGNIIIDRIIFFRVLCRLFIVVIMILLIHQRQDRRCIVVILIIFIQLFCH